MIRKLSFIPLLVFLFAYGYSNDSTSVGLSKRIYLGISFTPGVSYRILRGKENQVVVPEAVGREIVKERNSQEKPTFGFNTGIRFGITATKYLTLESGIEYSYKSVATRIDNLTFGYSYLPNLTVDSSKLGYLHSLTVLHYIDIPLAANFLIGKKKIKAIISTGAYLNIIVGQTETTKFYSPSYGTQKSTKSSTDVGEYSSFNISPFLGVGVLYPFNNLMSLRILPQAQMQAIENDQGVANQYLWSAGINMALFFGFINIK